MRTLPSALTAAQKSPSSLPHPRVEVLDRVAGITRLTWTKLYTGSENPFFHAAAMPGDGSLIRLRVDTSYNLYRQRVTSPGPSSDFSQWTSWGVTSYTVALAAYGSAVFAFRVGLDGHLYRCESSDYGASWGSWIDMGDIAGSGTTRLACCFKNASSAIVIYSQSNAVYRRRWDGSTWEAAAAWSNTVNAISGLAVCHMGDWNLVVTGTAATTYKSCVWTCVYGDGYSASPGTWTSLQELTSAEQTSGVVYRMPCLDFPDVFRTFFVEVFTGSDETYQRPYWSHSLATAEFISNLWREPVPFNLSGLYGLAMCHSSTYVWLTRPDAVWRAPLTPASIELTSDVLLLTSDLKEISGEISVSLRNDDGRYNSIGTGVYAAIKLGSELLFSPGYKTPSGTLVSSGLAFWISGWEYVSQGPALSPSKGPRSHFVLKASDGWTLLEQWKARRQYTWPFDSKNIFQLLTWIHARAGLEFSSYSSSSALVNHYPAFTIHPGESGKTAVLRLLAMVPDVVYFRGNYAYNINPQASDSSAYSYGSGTTPHPIFEGRYITRNKETNRVQVFGSGVFTEDWDWDEINLLTDLLRQAKDINLTTTTKAHERGAAELRDAAIHAIDGFILVPLNCGQELYDVVEITDALAGLSVAKRRVLSLSHIYNPTKGQYVLKIGLGSP